MIVGAPGVNFRSLSTMTAFSDFDAFTALLKRDGALVLVGGLGEVQRLADAGSLGGMTAVTIAQDATPEASPAAALSRPAHIHTGTCDNVGEVVQPLQDLTAPVGTAAGQANAVVAETSFTNVPMTLDQMLASDHVINVHTSADQIDVYIACGALGGVLDANGALVIGLGPQDGSGFQGIAYLSPGADGASTDVSVFIAEGEDTGGV